MTDKRIAYGATCTWWDSIMKVGNNDGLPCCPHCRKILYEMPSIEEWWNGVDRYEVGKPRPGYRKFVEWLRGKCFPNYDAAEKAYDQEMAKKT